MDILVIINNYSSFENKNLQLIFYKIILERSSNAEA